MIVKLIAISRPVDEALSGAEDLIAYCARVSNPSNQLNSGTAGKLLKYLTAHQHWSPFEMVSATLSIKTTRTIARQILRHRSFSFQEFSQRYSSVQADPILSSVRLQDTASRQNSLKTDDVGLVNWWHGAQCEIADRTNVLYVEALRHGIAKEVARNILPEGLTESHLYMAGTIRSWLHYCLLRAGPETQLEHREVAQACREVLIEAMPSLKEALCESRSLGS